MVQCEALRPNKSFETYTLRYFRNHFRSVDLSGQVKTALYTAGMDINRITRINTSAPEYRRRLRELLFCDFFMDHKILALSFSEAVTAVKTPMLLVHAIHFLWRQKSQIRCTHVARIRRRIQIQVFNGSFKVDLVAKGKLILSRNVVGRFNAFHKSDCASRQWETGRRRGDRLLQISCRQRPTLSTPAVQVRRRP